MSIRMFDYDEIEESLKAQWLDLNMDKLKNNDIIWTYENGNIKENNLMKVFPCYCRG